ncbi:uncharacterized protein BXZ73DRAFT_79739 [Epithele typhae]|uniref:uncharacterized protein n=1 Tax=Epithele typhae TaxID=378194 RepID=UPI002008344A|nr:uncharacterized protein BXZ73DRAFT_79739 [Epithele typhae]KAH9922348.1 hypothetical protein BXZ73DRAFT_79739 [Epithele typhae]
MPGRGLEVAAALCSTMALPRPVESRDFPARAVPRHGTSLPASPAPVPARAGPAPRPSAVVRVANLRATPNDLLWKLFSHAASQINLSPPAPLHDPHDPARSSARAMYAVFASAHDARAALSLSCDLFNVSPAADSDFAVLPGLRRLHSEPVDFEITRSQSHLPHPYPPAIRAPLPLHAPRPLPVGLADGALDGPAYTLSSNPPNPRTSFRAGDWMCPASHCGAHNFQRNTTCIACGRGAPSAPQSPPGGQLPATARALAAAQAQMPSKPPPPQYPPLTPSGRALSGGGRVQNVSRDPLAPCVMYWPDNEPLPEPCQIRPVDCGLLTHPPIVNTGNKGAAEKQPGDWVCGKCSYHNWRRRKVCQTCFPYAEGNGDSISAAVQAERIALLANVLATQFNALDLNPAQPLPRSAPPYALRFPDRPSSHSSSPILPPLPLAHDRLAPGAPIYQTPASSLGLGLGERSAQHAALLDALVPRPSHTLLPAFLHALVSPPRSPLRSPASLSSSPELSFDGSSEDAHYHLPRKAPSSAASAAAFAPLARPPPSPRSIWRLDGEESRTYSSAASSARTSPTPGFAHAAGSPPPRADVDADAGFELERAPFLADDDDDDDTGTTPKGPGGFWRAAQAA